jgi:hypothetical protein
VEPLLHVSERPGQRLGYRRLVAKSASQSHRHGDNREINRDNSPSGV